jgi:hypothetical protein
MAPADAPRLAWSVTGASTVSVQGPGINATTTTGDVMVCPTGPGSFCLPPLGPHVYTLTARDASGMVIAERTATLTVTGT